MSKLLLVIGVLFSVGVLYSQDDGNCNLEVNKKAKKVYEKALDNIHIDPSGAVAEVKKAIDIDPEFLEANYFLARYYFDYAMGKDNLRADQKGKMRDKSIAYFKEVHRICPSFGGHGSSYYLGVLYNEVKDDDKTYEYWTYYFENEKEIPEERKEKLDYIYSFIKVRYEQKANPVQYDPAPVNGINTEKDEYLPMLSPDNEKIYFTRLYDATMTDEEIFEQLMEARLMKIDSFSSGMPLGGPFDDEILLIDGEKVIGKGGITITPDNKHLFVTIVKLSETKTSQIKNTDIYYSDFVNGTWTDLKSIGDNVNNEGGPTWEGQPTISSDGQMIIFSTVRDSCISVYNPVGGYEQPTMDLYMIKREGKGWSNPVSLGDVINTKGHEKTPFLHTDSKTLYFSSNGHPGMGGYDIFYSRQDEYGNWSTPKNIGYPINTEKDEHGFIVSLDGKLGYMASGIYRAEDGEALQIISFPIPQEAKPQKVIMVKGQMKDSNGDPVTDGSLEIKNTKTGEISEAYVDGSTGEYVAVMTVEEETEEIELNGVKEEVKKEDSEPVDYILTAKKEGSAFSSTVVSADPDEVDGATKVRGREITVDPVKTNKPYRINDITFATNSAELNGRTVIILDEFIEFLLDNPEYKVVIQGHTDNVGDDQKNMQLSHDRAKAVHDYLLLNDIDASRLSYKGFGETKPVASNNTEAGRAQNRRTEFVLKK